MHDLRLSFAAASPPTAARGEKGEPGCTRPYGSYRPTEPFRDYPFLPTPEDMTLIRAELALDAMIRR